MEDQARLVFRLLICHYFACKDCGLTAYTVQREDDRVLRSSQGHSFVSTAMYGKRIAAARKKLGLSQRALASKVGRSQGFISDIEAGRADPSFDFLVKLWKSCGVDPNWIVKGETTSTLPDRTRPQPGEVRIGDQEYSTVQVFDVDAAAGKGIVPVSEGVIDRLAFSRSWLMRNGLCADLSGMVRVRGDSMVPTIPDGALVLVDLRGRADWSVPGIYIVRHEGAIMVKRLVLPRVSAEKWVALISDNPAYLPVFIAAPLDEDFQPIARVRAVFTTL